MKEFEFGSNEWLYQMYLKKGEVVIFTSTYDGTCKRGKVLDNYKNGEIRVEYTNGIKEEIIGVDQILFTTK